MQTLCIHDWSDPIHLHSSWEIPLAFDVVVNYNNIVLYYYYYWHIDHYILYPMKILVQNQTRVNRLHICRLELNGNWMSCIGRCNGCCNQPKELLRVRGVDLSSCSCLRCLGVGIGCEGSFWVWEAELVCIMRFWVGEPVCSPHI